MKKLVLLMMLTAIFCSCKSYKDKKYQREFCAAIHETESRWSDFLGRPVYSESKWTDIVLLPDIYCNFHKEGNIFWEDKTPEIPSTACFKACFFNYSGEIRLQDKYREDLYLKLPSIVEFMELNDSCKLVITDTIHTQKYGDAAWLNLTLPNGKVINKVFLTPVAFSRLQSGSKSQFFYARSFAEADREKNDDMITSIFNQKNSDLYRVLDIIAVGDYCLSYALQSNQVMLGNNLSSSISVHNYKWKKDIPEEEFWDYVPDAITRRNKAERLDIEHFQK